MGITLSSNQQLNLSSLLLGVLIYTFVVRVYVLDMLLRYLSCFKQVKAFSVLAFFCILATGVRVLFLHCFWQTPKTEGICPYKGKDDELGEMFSTHPRCARTSGVSS